ALRNPRAASLPFPVGACSMPIICLPIRSRHIRRRPSQRRCRESGSGADVGKYSGGKCRIPLTSSVAAMSPAPNRRRFAMEDPTMRKIIATTFVSLDGVMQAPGGPDEDPTGGFKFGGWTFPYFDEALGASMDEIFAKPFDLLLGRRTYDIFAAFWP